MEGRILFFIKNDMRKQIYIMLVIFFKGYLYAECSDLNYSECIQWSDYCEWNNETGTCSEIGGGGETDYGPYEYSFLTESDGIRVGYYYQDGILFYPTESEYISGSVILTPGFGGGSSTMSPWAEFYASHGFLSMIIGPIDEINDSHYQRAEGLIDAIETIKQENDRNGSPVFGLIDTNKFIVSGYSMGGGASQIALTFEDSSIDEFIVGAISLNPTILIEDCDICASYDYCICLVPEFLNHMIPTFIIAGENEINELPDYDGLLGQDIYENTPETTLKILYEIQNGSHSSAEFPSGIVQEKALYWVKYHFLNDLTYCDSLLVSPDNASQFLTTLECSNLPSFDLNGDGIINNSDFTMLLVFVLNGDASVNSLDINLDSYVDIFDMLILSDYLQDL